VEVFDPASTRVQTHAGYVLSIILIAVFINLFRRNIPLPLIILQRYGLGYLTRPMSELISESTNLLEILVEFIGRRVPI
jgi:hypothetical protein